MTQFKKRMKIIAREEYAEELQKVEQENIDLKNENLNIKNKYNNIKTEFKKRMIELEKIPNLSPKAKKIINTPLFN